MEQNKELRFLVDTMLKTYDQLNWQIAEELAAGTTLLPIEIVSESSEKLMEFFWKKSDFEQTGQTVYLFKTRGFREKLSDLFTDDWVYEEFLDTFSNLELKDFIDRIMGKIEALRQSIIYRLKAELEEQRCVESA